jgi:hypothetical protein
MNVDELLRGKLRPATGIRELIENPHVESPDKSKDETALEDLPPLPRPGDEYQAHARSSNKPVLTLRFLLADASVRGFSYANLDTIDLVDGDRPDSGPAIIVRFACITGLEARIEGRHLDRLYDQLGHHRIAWVRELPPRRDFKEPGKAVINRISFKLLED